MSQLFPASPLRAAALAALCVAALPQSALATNGYFSHGYGVKSQAIAGVGIALPQDGLTTSTRPRTAPAPSLPSSNRPCAPTTPPFQTPTPSPRRTLAFPLQSPF